MKTLISSHGSLKLMKQLVPELIAKTNRFEGYTYEAMAPIRELAETDYSFTDMRLALLNMAENNPMLRYGNTLKAEHICSFRAYMIGNGERILAVRDGEIVSVPQAEADVTDPDNHWIVVRHDDENYYCLYNLGTGYWLSVGSKINADSVPHKLTLGFANGKTYIREKNIFVGFNSAGNPITVAAANAARFELLDNYYLTPRTALCEALLEQTTSEAIATGIDEIVPSLTGEDWEDASLSNDIAAVYYYDMQGRRIGYALPAGETVIAHIILRNGASIVRKIAVK